MAKIKPTKKLPDKPSDLIRLAVDDITRVEAMKDKYFINMKSWHEPAKNPIKEIPLDNWAQPFNTDPDKRCAVCFAGSVMTCTLKADKGKRYTPEKFNADTRDKLEALNDFRTGAISDGFINLGIEVPSFVRLEDVEIVQYEDNPAEFKEQMIGIADELSAFGF